MLLKVGHDSAADTYKERKRLSRERELSHTKEANGPGGLRVQSF